MLLAKGGGGTIEIRVRRGLAPQISVVHRNTVEVITLTAAERAGL